MLLGAPFYFASFSDFFFNSATVLAEDAIRSAIQDYRTKRAKLAQTSPGFIDVSQNVAAGETAHPNQTSPLV